ncbi:hypothetical protein Tco_0975830 [Tanacetum coccineum]|uniref:Uncharacterized protein n=1 Tax=Tanacetum coccineum TaxID=301880 RepID=A0ABQ5EFT5_9ASTR
MLFSAVASENQDLELYLSSLGAMNTMFAAIFSKLGVLIKTTVSATVLEEALNGTVTIQPIALGQPIVKKVEKQCAHFYSVTITEKEAQAGLVCRVQSSDKSKFKLLYFDQQENGGLNLALQEDSAKTGKVSSAGMYFLGFPVYRLDKPSNSVLAQFTEMTSRYAQEMREIDDLLKERNEIHASYTTAPPMKRTSSGSSGRKSRRSRKVASRRLRGHSNESWRYKNSCFRWLLVVGVHDCFYLGVMSCQLLVLLIGLEVLKKPPYQNWMNKWNLGTVGRDRLCVFSFSNTDSKEIEIMGNENTTKCLGNGKEDQVPPRIGGEAFDLPTRACIPEEPLYSHAWVMKMVSGNDYTEARTMGSLDQCKFEMCSDCWHTAL